MITIGSKVLHSQDGRYGTVVDQTTDGSRYRVHWTHSYSDGVLIKFNGNGIRTWMRIQVLREFKNS